MMMRAILFLRSILAIITMMVSSTTTFAAAAAATASSTTKKKTKTDFISCSNPCNGGDVNYVLTASIRTLDNIRIKDKTYKYKGRMYDNPSTNNNYMGPTMHVQPGQSLWIKFINNMTNPDHNLGPKEPTEVEYWKMLQNPGENIKYQRYKKRVKEPTDLKVDWPNIPSHFDSTNLHLHGLDIEVHMFDPVGTHNPEAPHIVIDPGECYCYRFTIPKHHPTGMYWYHPHLHGSTALQIWSGMMGLLYIDGGPLLQELANYGITNSQEFVIWDPAFKSVDDADDHNLEVDDFLMGQTTLSKIHPFLVNGVMTPNFDIELGEVLHFRVLCGTIENENTFIVYREGEEKLHWDDAALPFYVIASDGVTCRTPRRRNIMVLAGGQREEVLLPPFEEPGRYVISQQGIEGMQFFDMRGHPHNQILATITVKEGSKKKNVRRPKIPISEMVFTPGYEEEEDIQAENMAARSENIVFSMGANFDEIPFPQYYVNGRSFDPDRLDFTAQPGEAREYILINANHNVHPFHIHVNRFQVKEMGSELSTETYPVLKSVMDFDPNVWRDTVVVPPNGRTRIWVQYKNYTGKTVFHCHFLAHEDTGMMATLFIGLPDRVFHIKDHFPLLLGVCVGVLAAIGLVATMSLLGIKDGKKKTKYTAVAMNALKSKTVD